MRAVNRTRASYACHRSRYFGKRTSSTASAAQTATLSIGFPPSVDSSTNLAATTASVAPAATTPAATTSAATTPASATSFSFGGPLRLDFSSTSQGKAEDDEVDSDDKDDNSDDAGDEDGKQGETEEDAVENDDEDDDAGYIANYDRDLSEKQRQLNRGETLF